MYTKEVKLLDHQRLAIIDDQTGEIKEVRSKPSNNENAVKFDAGKFVKHHTGAWSHLALLTTKFEYAVANMMSNHIKMFSNSLQPLSDDTTVSELSKQFGISMGKVKSTFDRLFQLGVYGKFEICEKDTVRKKYWIFNPYLSFNGQAIDKGVKDLFSETIFAKL